MVCGAKNKVNGMEMEEWREEKRERKGNEHSIEE